MINNVLDRIADGYRVLLDGSSIRIKLLSRGFLLSTFSYSISSSFSTSDALWSSF